MIVQEILKGGVWMAAPPAGVRLGAVYHFWDKLGIVGVQTTAAVTVNSGDIVAIQLPRRFHQVEVTESKIDDSGRLTFKLDLKRSDVPIGSRVYLLNRELSFQPESDRNEEGELGFGEVLAGGIVHPSRNMKTPLDLNQAHPDRKNTAAHKKARKPSAFSGV